MLRITKQTDYAIVLMTYLAADAERRVHNAPDLARVVNLPQPTVGKILKALTRAGLLESHRGAKGGYALAREPEAISIEEVIVALEGPIAITECLDTQASDCEIVCSCPVQANWQRINGAVRDALRTIPLTEMAPQFTFLGPATHERGGEGEFER